jgi:hypothetical protein
MNYEGLAGGQFQTTDQTFSGSPETLQPQAKLHLVPCPTRNLGPHPRMEGKHTVIRRMNFETRLLFVLKGKANAICQQAGSDNSSGMRTWLYAPTAP